MMMNSAKGSLTPARGPIFLVGCERSGTTLLRAMLNAHPRIAIPYEARRFSQAISWPSPWDYVFSREEVVIAVEEFLINRKVRFWQLEKAAVLEELGVSETCRYPDLLRAIYRAYAKREGKPRWGDKTPANTFEVPRLIRAFPEAQFLHIVRDGRDVYLSWLTVDWARYDLANAARQWAKWVRAAAQAGALGTDRYHVLRYEDLIARPHDTLRDVCRFLDEPFVEDMLRYPEQDGLVPVDHKPYHELLSRAPDRSRAYRWKQEMMRRDVRRFEHIAGPTLVTYGYEVSPSTRVRTSIGSAVRQARQRVKDVAVNALHARRWQERSQPA